MKSVIRDRNKQESKLFFKKLTITHGQAYFLLCHKPSIGGDHATWKKMQFDVRKSCVFSIINFEKVKTARKCIRDSRRLVRILWRELDLSIVIPTLANQLKRKNNNNHITISDSFFQSLQ